MDRKISLFLIFGTILIFPSLTYADGPYLNIPPTNAFDKIRSDNGSINAVNYSMPLIIKGINGINVNSNNKTHSVLINFTGAGLGKISSTIKDLNSSGVYYTVFNNDTNDTLITATAEPTSPQFTRVVSVGNMPTDTNTVQDYYVVIAIGGKNTDANTRTLNAIVTVNGVDQSSVASNTLSVIPNNFWRCFCYTTVKVNAGDIVGVKMWSSLSNTIDFRYATLYFVPFTFKAQLNQLGQQISSTSSAFNIISLNGTLSGVSFVTGSTAAYQAWDGSHLSVYGTTALNGFKMKTSIGVSLPSASPPTLTTSVTSQLSGLILPEYFAYTQTFGVITSIYQGTYNETLANNAMINSGGNRINFINGTGTFRVVNDPTRNQVNITDSTTGGSSFVPHLLGLGTGTFLNGTQLNSTTMQVKSVASNPTLTITSNSTTVLFNDTGTNADLLSYHRSGVWYQNSEYNAPSSAALSVNANRTTAIPMIIGKAFSITDIGYSVTVAGVGRCMVSIYDDNGTLYPNKLIVSGTDHQLSGTTGVRSDAVTVNFKADSIYWQVYNCGAVGSANAMVLSVATNPGILGLDTSVALFTKIQGYQVISLHPSNGFAFPSTFQTNATTLSSGIVLSVIYKAK
jgi:hypothetical protein